MHRVISTSLRCLVLLAVVPMASLAQDEPQRYPVLDNALARSVGLSAVHLSEADAIGAITQACQPFGQACQDRKTERYRKDLEHRGSAVISRSCPEG
jgi:hypothetical protein